MAAIASSDETTVALQALGAPVRRRLLEELRQSEECVTTLAERLGLSTALASHHLQVLTEAGLVQERSEGRWRCYSVVPERLNWLRRRMDGLLDTQLPPAARPHATHCGCEQVG